MPRKRSAQEIARAQETTSTRRTGPRKDRANAPTKAGGKQPIKPRGQRVTAAEIAARNAEIVKLREVDRLMWEEIAQRYGIDEKTARRGYDDHMAAREHVQSFDRAMRDMREYVSVLIRNQQVLARIAHELDEEEVPAAEEGAEPTRRQIRRDVRERIAALHEGTDQMFKEIAIRQAIGDLPARFAEMTAARDMEWAIEQIMAVLKENGVPRKVFVEIERVMGERAGVAVPKTHLSAVEQ